MRRIAAVAGLITVAVLVSACSGSSSSGKSAVGSAPAQLGAPARAPGAAPADAKPTTGTLGGASLAATAVIRTASMHVEIARWADVPRQADAAGQIAVAAGGSVFADDRTAGEHGSAQLTLKVPPDSLTVVLSRLSALGKELTRQSSSQDVTSQVADVNSRVRSAQDSLDRLRALYTRATKIADVIAIESEIAQREGDLESLEAQQRTLDAQTSMATVQLYLSAGRAVVTTQHHDRRGFFAGLSGGWRAFTSAAISVATGLGAALPFLVLLALIGTAAWRLRPRRVRHIQTPPAPIVE